MNHSSTMRKRRLFRLNTAPVILVLGVYLVSVFFPTTIVWQSPRLDSVLDGIGAYIALNLALLLYLIRDYLDGDTLVIHSWAAAGVAAIGIFKFASSMTENMDYVLWAHVAERLVGAGFFACAYLFPRQDPHSKFIKFLPVIAVAFSSSLAVALLTCKVIPAFSGTQLSVWVKVLNPMAGLVFLVAAYTWRKRPKRHELKYIDWIYSLFPFYASSALLYPFTYLWGPRWWLTQLLELAPFLLALYEKVRAYSQIQVQLIKTSNALSESNRKLEHFAYMASHDLQEPLRTIQSYLTLIERGNVGKHDQSTREFLIFCRDAATRMRTYIVDLLGYTRIDTVDKGWEIVDAVEIVGEAKANLGRAISISSAQIIYTALPKLKVVRSQLLILIQNLLSNSIKYRSGEPKISISSEKKNDEVILRVLDNGVGFDPKQAETIFELFHRAHGKNEYEGTGIGLASCKKIVEGWGGRIWATSNPGQGAAFYVAIPMNRVAES
jgi:signal transduction histidine kinase